MTVCDVSDWGRTGRGRARGLLKSFFSDTREQSRAEQKLLNSFNSTVSQLVRELRNDSNEDAGRARKGQVTSGRGIGSLDWISRRAHRPRILKLKSRALALTIFKGSDPVTATAIPTEKTGDTKANLPNFAFSLALVKLKVK